MLADLGCDVYLANNRGTVYSLTHERWSVKDKEFWDFSFQDMALDQKANLQMISERTNGKKVHYFGHSQGSVQMIAGLSDENREIANTLHEKIEMFHALAPVVYMVICLYYPISYFLEGG